MSKYNLLDRINSSADLKALSTRELSELAGQIRQYLVDVVGDTGGHLASNLGVVELTLALHSVFDSTRDRIVWDVGHQSYVHKIITGRREAFPTLRRFGGLSGFPKRSESPSDAFGTGHSSTAISAALGMARARDISGQSYHVVAVVGDGAMTGGMAWEALNDAGHGRDRLIILLNDNDMSISRNVGAISGYLTRLRTRKSYRVLKKSLIVAVGRLPWVGRFLQRWLERIKNSMKYLLVPGMYFEEMGIQYFGPIDGHDLDQLKGMLEFARQAEGPVLIHAVTVKGKGYHPAQEDPLAYHMVPAKSCASLSGTPGCDVVVGEWLTRRARQDHRLCVLTAAMPEGCGLHQYAQEHPRRFFDAGIAEEHVATLAAGLAAAGMRPVYTVYSSFLQRAYDQVLHDICLQKLPVTLAVSHSGIVNGDGETHQGIYDYAFLRSMPFIHVLAPTALDELEAALDYALNHDGPVAVCYPKGSLPQTWPGAEEARPLRWRWLNRPLHPRAVILAAGAMAQVAWEAAQQLERSGVMVRVAACGSIKPLDSEMLDSLIDQPLPVFTLEDHVQPGGFGSAVAEYGCQREPRGAWQLHTLGLPDAPLPQGTVGELRHFGGISPVAVAQRIMAVLAGRSSGRAALEATD